jgi:hypothetical protein
MIELHKQTQLLQTYPELPTPAAAAAARLLLAMPHQC